jgi:hypothetical protein
VERLELYRGEHPQRAVEAPVVVPVDPAGRRELDVRKGPERSRIEDGRADVFGLEQAVHRLHERVTVSDADSPVRGRDALEREMLGQPNRCVLRSGAAVMDPSPR